MRTSLKQCQGDRSHNINPPHTHTHPSSKASWEACPSAAYISLQEVQCGLKLPTDIQVDPFIFPSYSLLLWLPPSLSLENGYEQASDWRWIRPLSLIHLCCSSAWEDVRHCMFFLLLFVISVGDCGDLVHESLPLTFLVFRVWSKIFNRIPQRYPITSYMNMKCYTFSVS